MTNYFMYRKYFLFVLLLAAFSCFFSYVSGTTCLSSGQQGCNCGGVCCYQVEENQPAGVFLGRVQDIPDTEVQNFLSQGAQLTITTGSNVVMVNSNGTLRTAITLDRETQSCRSAFLQVSVNTQSKVVTITVQVLDLNDNAPQFTSGPIINLTVPETNQAPTQVSCSDDLLATDSDNGQNGTVTNYTVLHPSQSFNMCRNNVDKLCLCNLVPLDREKQTSINITILARDNGTIIQRTSTLTVILTLSDINDNPPTFINFTSSSQVPENTPINQTVLQYTATDPDIGNNGAIVFTLSSNSPVPFGLTSNGTLYVSQPLDADSNCVSGVSYTFNVILSNVQNGPTTTAETTVTITGINDLPPIITPDLKSVSIYEGNVSQNILFAVYTLTDPDCNSVVSGIIISGNEYANLRQLNTETFVLSSINFMVNREQTEVIHITMLFKDDGNPPLSATTTYYITVLDVNDNPPNLTRTLFSISENTTKFRQGVPIATLSQYFIDPDNGSNGTLQKFEKLSNENLVSLQSNGQMTLEKIPDREAIGNNFSVSIRVFDAGTPQLSSDITIIIIINDTNDNAPNFVNISNHTALDITENLPQGTLITTIHTTDGDIGSNADVTYQLRPTNSSNFYINSSSGELYSNRAFDREVASSYEVVVVATDGGTPPLDSTINLIINITDVNDNPPHFNDSFYNFTISSDSPIGTQVNNVSATDPDVGVNGQVIYSSNSKYFGIHENGTIYVNSTLVSDNVTFMITAYNPDNKDLNDTVYIDILITAAPLTPTPSSQVVIMYVAYIGAPVAGGLLLSILCLVCLICTVRCYRHRFQSRDLYKATNHGGSPRHSTNKFPVPKKSSLRSVPVAGSRYEDSTGFYKPKETVIVPKSPTVNFSEESEVRFYNTEQVLNQSNIYTVRVQAEEIELKQKLTQNLSDEFTPPTQGTPSIETKIHVCSPSLSDDLSTSPSIAQNHDLSHFYNSHSMSTSSGTQLPVLREDLLKKHDQEYAFPSAIIEPGESEDCDDSSPGVPRLPPAMHNYHMTSSVTPPTHGSMAHYPYQNGTLPVGGGSDTSPAPLHYSRSLPPSHQLHYSLPHPPQHYYQNGGHHAHPRTRADMYYKPTLMNGGGASHIQQLSSSSSSSHHRSPHVQPSTTTADYSTSSSSSHFPLPPPQTYYHSSSSSSNDSSHIQSNTCLPSSFPSPMAVGNGYIPPHLAHVPGQPHPLIHILEDDYRHSNGSSHTSSIIPSTSTFSSVPRTSDEFNFIVEDEDDDTSTVASSVLDQYLQFEPTQLRHHCLSLSVDDMKLSSTRHDSQT